MTASLAPLGAGVLKVGELTFVQYDDVKSVQQKELGPMQVGQQRHGGDGGERENAPFSLASFLY